MLDQNLPPLTSPESDPLLWSSCRPRHDSAWHGHVSFAHWLVHSLRPGVIVELGTHTGVSFAAFCNAVRRGGLPTRCFAVDTWTGDDHAGHYDESVYLDLLPFINNNFGSFATLMRCLFDQALEKFEDGTVDLLHIDGLHTYEAVKHDFDTWLPKMSERGVILFHDTCVHRPSFGVWKFWDELSPRYPHFNFTHSAGLGVLAVGASAPPPILSFCALSATGEMDAIREKFSRMSDSARKNGLHELSNPMPPLNARRGRNIALHCSAAQSSNHPGQDMTPQGAVNGVKTGLYGFHTLSEKDPWWMLDFGEQKTFDDIVVFNRLDGPCKPRSRTLRVLISDDAASWAEIYAHDGTPFGGTDGFPLHIRRQGTRARFVKLQLNEVNYLHLDEVEIYAPADP